jgi:hypothetical protein
MKRGALVFATAFACAVLAGLAENGCVGADECDCPVTPEQPEPQGPIGGLEVMSFDANGNSAGPMVEPGEGTMEVTTDRVVFRYRQAGVEHEIGYEVTGPE